MSTKLCGYSDVKMTEITYEWEIKKFSSQSPKVGHTLLSPVFYSSANKEAAWQLVLRLKGGEEYSDYVSFHLKLQACKQKQIRANQTLYVCNSETSNEYSGTKEWKVGNEWGYNNFLERSKILNPAENYLVDDTFTVGCNLKTYVNVSYNSTYDLVDTSLQPTIDNYQFVNEFESFVNEGHPFHSDLTIVCGSEKFQVPRIILTIRSSVFATLLSNEELTENKDNESERDDDEVITNENHETKLDNGEMTENKHNEKKLDDGDTIRNENNGANVDDEEVTEKEEDNEIEIEDLSPEILKEMLHYIYTDKIRNEGFALELLDASEKYQLKGLKAMCELILIKNLHQINAAEILIASNLHNAEQLKEKVLDFICDHEEEVWAVETFDKMIKSHPRLLADIHKARTQKNMSK